MRIAIFSPTLSGRGGIEAAIRGLMRGFQETGDETRLCLFGGSFDKAWLDGLQHSIFGTPDDSRLVRFFHYATAPLWLFLKWKPDAVICADVTTLRMARMARALSRRKVVLCLWPHFPIAQLRMKKWLPLADVHLAISQAIADDIGAEFPSEENKIAVVLNPVDQSGVVPLPRPQNAEFLYVGRLTWDDQKRVNDLLTAVSRLQGAWRLRVVGAAPEDKPQYAAELKEYAAQLQLEDRVEWLGWQAEPWRVATQATALVLTSSREGMPMILIEAISRGVFCISSDCRSGPSEILQEGINGHLFPVGDTDRLTELLQTLVDHPNALPSQEQIVATADRFSPRSVAGRAKAAILRPR